MLSPDELNIIVERIASGTETAKDIEILRAVLTNREQEVLQLGKYNISIRQGQNVQIGDIVYPELNNEALQALAHHIFQKLQTTTNQLTATQIPSVKELVQQVRSRCCDKVLKLYSKIQLLNRQLIEVDRLYVDVYMLEKLSNASYATIPGLLEGGTPQDSSDRLGLAKRKKRSRGLEVARQHSRLMVVGKPGSGKSIFLRHLAVACAKGEFLADYIPVLFELRLVKDGSQFNLWNVLKREFRLTDQAQVEQVLDQGQVLLLLDGLDEVPFQSRQAVQDHILEFNQQYYDSRFIFTCRTQTTEYVLPTFEPMEVADFNPKQVKAFAENWFGALAETPEEGTVLKEQFMAKLWENRSTVEVAVTPILLSLMCWVFGDMKDLPPKRSDLYEKGICLLLRQWDEQRGIRREVDSKIYRQLSVKERQWLLSYVAARKLEQQQYVLFEQNEIQGYIAEYLDISTEDGQAVLKAVEVQHGLLIEQAQHIYSFSHLTFQEYFTAKYFVERTDWEGLASHVTKPHWREVFLLTTDILNNADDLLLLMKNQVDSLLASEEKLQQFLSWGNQKSCSIKFFCKTTVVPYKLTAIRAFYHGLAVKVAYYVKVSVYHFSDVTHTVTAFDIANIIDPSFAALALDDMVRLVDIDCNPSSGGIAALAFDHTAIVILVNAFPRAPEPDLVSAFLRDLRRSCEPNSELGHRLIELKKLFRSLHLEDQEIPMWGQWAEKFRDVIIEHRNIGHDWQFSDEQKELLQQYYNANKLLVDCLSSGCMVSDEVRQEIEETLLLPTAEIEKHKVNKREVVRKSDCKELTVKPC